VLHLFVLRLRYIHAAEVHISKNSVLAVANGSAPDMNILAEADGNCTIFFVRHNPLAEAKRWAHNVPKHWNCANFHHHHKSLRYFRWTSSHHSSCNISGAILVRTSEAWCPLAFPGKATLVHLQTLLSLSLKLSFRLRLCSAMLAGPLTFLSLSLKLRFRSRLFSAKCRRLCFASKVSLLQPSISRMSSRNSNFGKELASHRSTTFC